MSADPAKQWVAMPGQEINPTITAVISFFTLFTGYGLLGQFFKAVNYVILYAITIGIGLCCFIVGVYPAIAIVIIFHCFHAVDVAFLAQRVQQGKPIMKGEVAFPLIVKLFFLVKKFGVIPFISDAPDAPGDYKSKVPGN